MRNNGNEKREYFLIFKLILKYIEGTRLNEEPLSFPRLHFLDAVNEKCFYFEKERRSSVSLLSHSADINDLLEGLDGVLEDGLDGLHDTESSLHIIDLGLHAFDGLHLSGNFD